MECVGAFVDCFEYIKIVKTKMSVCGFPVDVFRLIIDACDIDTVLVMRATSEDLRKIIHTQNSFWRRVWIHRLGDPPDHGLHVTKTVAFKRVKGQISESLLLRKSEITKKLRSCSEKIERRLQHITNAEEELAIFRSIMECHVEEKERVQAEIEFIRKHK